MDLLKQLSTRLFIFIKYYNFQSPLCCLNCCRQSGWTGSYDNQIITLKIRLWGRIILRIREMLLQKIQQEKIRFLKR